MTETGTFSDQDDGPRAEHQGPDEGVTGLSDTGGDPVCWAPRVCPECGLFVPLEPPTICPRCGTAVGID